MKHTTNPYRTFNITLTSSNYVSDNTTNNITNLINTLQPEYNKTLTRLQNDHEWTKKELKNSGKFRNQVLKTDPKNYLTWDLRNKAKFYRIIIERARQVLLAQNERKQIATILEQNDWQPNKAFWGAIKKQKIHTTTATVKNIIASKGSVNTRSDAKFVLDYATEDAQLSIVQFDGHTVTFDVLTGQEWETITVDIPAWFKGPILRVARPRFLLMDDELVLSVSCEIEPLPGDRGDGVLGVDLGIVRPFVAAAVYKRGYSAMLVPSRETQALGDKLRLLVGERACVRGKIERIARLLVGREDLYLSSHYMDLCDYAGALSGKISRVKVCLERLVARDVVVHALCEGCGEVHVEDLSWLGSRGGGWDFSGMIGEIESACELVGVRVVRVSAVGSSHEDPFTGEFVSPGRDRVSCTSRGGLDRDYSASLVIGGRSCGRGGCERSRLGGCRDRHAGFVKLPCVVSRKGLFKEVLGRVRAFRLSHCRLVFAAGACFAVTPSGSSQVRVPLAAQCEPVKDSSTSLLLGMTGLESNVMPSKL